MSDALPLPDKKKQKTVSTLSEEKKKEILLKLNDKDYMYGAIYRIATVLTDQILSSGGLNSSEDQK